MKSLPHVRLSRLLFVPFCLVISAGVWGDDAVPQQPDKDQPAVRDDVQEALKAYPSPSAEDAQAFADALGEVIYIPNPKAWEGVFDWDLFMDLCFAGITIHSESRKGFEQGFVGAMKSKNGLIGQVHDSLGESGSYELVRVHEVDGRQRALFRLVNDDGGINYHDYILAQDERGRPRAVDVYIYLTGEDYSTTARRMIEKLAADENRGFFDRLLGNQGVFSKNILKLQEITQLVLRGDGAAALEIYHGMPEELKKNKLYLIQRYSAATILDDEQQSFRELEATVETFRQEYPQDACLDFMAIDYHLAREEYDQALQDVDRLDKAVGGDVYLHELRGGIRFLAGQLDKAVEQFEMAIAALPERSSTYFSLMGVAMARKDYAELLGVLKRLDQAVEMEWNDFREIPDYAEFVASPYFAQWLEYLEEKP